MSLANERLETLRKIYADNESMGAGDVRDLIGEVDRLRRVRVNEEMQFGMIVGQWRERVDVETGLRTEQAKRALALQDILDAELSKSAALTRCMLDIAAELRADQARCLSCNIAKPEWAGRLEAARAATYGKAERRPDDWARGVAKVAEMRAEAEKLRADLADARSANPTWGNGIASELADRGMLNLTREIDQLRAAIVELESIRKRVILADLKGDGAGLDELQRRRAHLFELCGVK